MQWCCIETAFMAFKAPLCHSLWTCYQHCSQFSCWHYCRSCFNRIGCIALSLSFIIIMDGLFFDWTLLLGAILVFLVCYHLYRWAFSFFVQGYVKIINNLNFAFDYASFLLFLLVGFSFPSPITPVGLTSPLSHLCHSNLGLVALHLLVIVLL
jgi:hypothetical protein